MGERLYRRLLGLLPEDFRADLGEAMTEHAAARARDGGAALYWTREYASLVRVALQERWRARRRNARRTQVGEGMMDGLRELRFAARRLVRAPTFTIASLLTLSLALGAAIAIWAVVKNVVVDPLPYESSADLVLLEHGLPGVGATSGVNITDGLFALYRDDARTLESAAMYQTGPRTLTGVGDPVSLQIARTTPGLARVLRVQPMLGRWFEADAGRSGDAREVVLSHGVWVSRFGSDPAVLGRAILLDETPYEVIGVMPRGFAFPETDVQVWTALEEPGTDARPGGFNYSGIGRLSAGATLASLRTDLDALILRLPEVYPAEGFARRLLDDGKLNAQPVFLKERTVGSVAQTMWVLLATVGLALLLAAANVANLFLVRSEARQTELAVRRALGAGRRGVAAQYLAESTILSALGGAAGLAVAVAATSLLRAHGPERLPRLDEVGIDAGVLGVAALLCVGMALFLAVVPLLRRQPALARTIQDAGRRNSAGGARVRARGVLVATQVALAVVLLVACGLMTRSFVHMSKLDHGFDADGVLTFHLALPSARYPENASAVLFHEQLLERIGGLPGVTAASVVSCAPLEGWCYGDPLGVDGRPADGPTPPVVMMRMATPSFFATLGIDVEEGRVFEDAENAVPLAVVNRALVDAYFPDEDPIGQRVRPGPAEYPGSWATIVGVVENTATMSVTETSASPAIYFPLGFVDYETGISRRRVTYVIRASTPPLGVLPAIRAAVHELDADLALADATTLERSVADSGARISFAMVLLAIAALTALLLGAVGIYGVISYTVTRRTSEIGVRLALGAKPREVVGMIVRQGTGAIGAGLVTGLVAALAFGRFMDSILFGVPSTDLATYAAVAILLAVLSAAAMWVPARRAAGLDPVSALRAE